MQYIYQLVVYADRLSKLGVGETQQSDFVQEIAAAVHGVVELQTTDAIKQWMDAACNQMEQHVLSNGSWLHALPCFLIMTPIPAGTSS